MHTTIQLDAAVAQKIGVVAHRLHQSPEACVRQALEAFLEDQEDIFEATQALERIAKGEKTYTLEEVCAELGIDLGKP